MIEESTARGSLIYESITQPEKVVVPHFVLSFSRGNTLSETCLTRPNSFPTHILTILSDRHLSADVILTKSSILSSSTLTLKVNETFHATDHRSRLLLFLSKTSYPASPQKYLKFLVLFTFRVNLYCIIQTVTK